MMGIEELVMRDQATATDCQLEITPAMVDAGVAAVNRWAFELGVDDCPAQETLVVSILESILPLFHESAC